MIRLRIHLLGLWREVMRHSEWRVRKLDGPRIYARGIVIPAAPRGQLSFARGRCGGSSDPSGQIEGNDALRNRPWVTASRHLFVPDRL